MTVFNRKQYVERLLGARGNGLVKIVSGMRRCGKSFLLFKLFRDKLLEEGVEADHIIGLSLDDIENEPFLDPMALLRHIKDNVHSDGKVDYIILDEIQLVPNFVKLLLSLMHIPDVDVYVSGSNSRFLSSDVVTEFRGRGEDIRVRPLSLAEYIEGTGEDYDTAVKRYFLYGGLPQVALMDDAQQRENFLIQLYETTYLRDVIDRNGLRNAAGMRQLIDVLSSGIGSNTNPKKIADTFFSVSKTKLSDNTIRQYIDYLQDAFLIEEAQRYDIKGRRYIGADNKYYFSDPGLRNAILKFRQIEDTHIMENVIYNFLRSKGFLVDVGMVEVWTTDQEGKNKRVRLEVDFVVNRGSQRYYIQSAYALPSQEKERQEHRPLRQIPDSFRKIVIVYGDYAPRQNDAGIVTIGLKNFLCGDSLLLDM